MRKIFCASFLFLLLTFNFLSCSNLFENILNESGTVKTGDDSLIGRSSTNTEITSGLVVIKASDKEHNQITYDKNQTTYFVGKVPNSFDEEADYTNGSAVTLFGVDDPVEFRCFNNDLNAKISWSAFQTWEYVPETKIVTKKDGDGNEIKYTGIASRSERKLSVQKEVSLTAKKSESGSYVFSDLPYGVTVVTCKITADDEDYFTEYKIILTKDYICTHASDTEDSSNLTDHGLVVIKATAPDRNAINYSSTIYEYEVGDSTGANTSVDLTGRDDPVVFKCYLLDEKASLSWSARKIKTFLPEWDSDRTGVVSQTLQELEEAETFEIIGHDEENPDASKLFLKQVNSEDNFVYKSDLPYGVTEVTARISAKNEDEKGELVECVTEYKILLTKRYIITTGSKTSDAGSTGLSVYAKGNGSLISYSPEVLEYYLPNLTGSDDPVLIKYLPEEADFTTVEWTAVQTHTYEAELSEVQSGDGKKYTVQKSGKFSVLENPLDLIKGNLLSVNSEGNLNLCSGNLPYGITEVTVKAHSIAEDTETAYKIVLNKKRIATHINITRGDENLSTVTDNGFVVLSATDNYTLNHIDYQADTKNYSLKITQKDNGKDGMKFRCYLADTDANFYWTLIQTKTFTPTYSYREETDTLTEETVNVKYMSGQEENAAANILNFTETGDGENNEITSVIPYGVTELKANISSENEETNVYTITLTRNIYDPSVSQSGNASLLKELEISITSGDEEKPVVFDFNPEVTTYTLDVEEDADSITIDAIAEAMNAEVSDLKVITKYPGEVPDVSGMTSPLLGGSSRISFTVTDESTLERTYSIYVNKPEDGDTTLKSLTYTPEDGYENGVKGLTFDGKYKGESYSVASKYSMTLEASSRVDVSQVTFTALANRKRTKVSYGVSEKETTLPSQWSEDASYTVEIGDENKATIEKYLWIRTESDAYYHKKAGKYESEKTSDTLYHKVKLTKAGDLNTNLAELYVTAVYENLDAEGANVTKEILSLPLNKDKAIMYSVKDGSLGTKEGINTFTDKLIFRFRPLDKDAAVTYSAVNSEHASDENTSFTGYASDLVTLDESKRDDEGYYSFEIGDIEGGLTSTTDLPCGTTSVTICGVTYTFAKPDKDTVSYDVTAGDGSGNGGVYKPWTYYIYLDNVVESLQMNLSTKQQNEWIELTECTQTSGPNGSEVEGEPQNAGCTLHQYSVTEGENIVKWLLLVGNASENVEGFTKKEEANTPLSTTIPVGTTTLKFKVKNVANNASEDYIYYIIRESDSESRLNQLTLSGKTPGGFADANALNAADTSTNFYYVGQYLNPTTEKYQTEFPIDAGAITLYAHSVSSDATITVEKSHSNETKLSANESSISSAIWDEYESVGEGTGRVNASYTLKEDDTGTVLFRITVKSQDQSSERIYYIFVSVAADKTARLDDLEIVQKGNNADTGEDRIILKNEFDPEEQNYSELYASLNCTGDIIIKATKYPKAKFLEDGETGAWLLSDDGLTVDSIDFDVFDESFEDNGNTMVLTMNYDYYINHRGRTFLLAYKIQAQNESVLPVPYKVKFTIPDYEIVTEKITKTISSHYEYEVPKEKDAALGYRFGSVFADDGSAAFLKNKFGGIDIIGTREAQKDNALWYESSFASSGLQFIIEVDGIPYGVELNEHGHSSAFYTYDLDGKTCAKCTDENAPDVGLSVIPSFAYESGTPYLALELVLSNPEGKEIKLGGVMDTLVGTVSESTDSQNDSVLVEETNNGFTLKGSNYYFALFLKNAFEVDDVDNMWYGKYEGASFIKNVFDDSSASALSEGEDSALTFSWNLGSDASFTKKIRFSMGSVSE